ncbi:MAG: C-type lectin domain-containing protein [Deltaproteobacteria bacterium]|nr:C-type lectin domain-containing protein [Deltaproteobacteria bacterium]
MIKSLALTAVLALACAGCLRTTTFRCDDNADCNGGQCETTEGGFCSFADSSCTASGRRFGDHSGPSSNQCVGETAMIDGGPPGPDSASDAAPPTGCKATYMALPSSGPRGHRYLLQNANLTWVQHRDACAADGAFLAFPDGATLADAQAELAALMTLAGVNSWVGIADQITEGAYRTSLNQPVSAVTMMLIVTGGGNPNGQDCLVGTGTTITDESCNDMRKAVCECVP